MYFTYLLLNSDIYYITGNLHYISMMGLIPVFFGSGFRNKTTWNKSFVFSVIVCSIILSSAFEVIYGILQISGLRKTYHASDLITGTFFNPALMAGYLTVCLPYLVYGIKENGLVKKQFWPAKVLKHFALLVLLLSMIVIPLTQSRAGFVAAGMVLIFCFIPSRSLNIWIRMKNKVKVLMSIGFVLISATIGYFIYNINQQSVNGRFLIWKITSNAFLNKPLFGHGYHSFSRDYPLYQANYFEHNNNPGEMMLAGDVKWAFNEPLHLLFEQGIVGFLIISFIIIYAFTSKLNKSADLDLVRAARISILGMLIFGLFSYPCFSIPVCIIVVISLGIIAQADSRTVNAGFIGNNLQIPIIIIVMVSNLVCIPKFQKAYWLWTEGVQMTRIGALDKADSSFKKAGKTLQHNGEYLIDYAECLFNRQEFRKAISKLEHSKKYGSNSRLYQLLGDCYLQTKEFSKAEKAYMSAYYMVPKKFLPLYSLACLYKEWGKKKKCREIIDIAKNKPVKIYTKEVADIIDGIKDIEEGL